MVSKDKSELTNGEQGQVRTDHWWSKDMSELTTEEVSKGFLHPSMLICCNDQNIV